jgi:hypothetical protein
MASSQSTSHRDAQITIHRAYGHAPERAVECLVSLLARTGGSYNGAVDARPITEISKEAQNDGRQK